ncbi:TSUP family transporter [Aquamicrobium segne]|uniref:Probable membrane transporter protein n=1 Tax=Aquamicrobium segne TaxID=469547 RepID=A0ABW0GZW0_9HYPH
MFEVTADIVVLLALAAFIAGLIDSIAGGGGLITIPALLLAGMPPVETLGTNKLQGLFGSGSATIAYASKGHVKLRSQLPAAMLALFGSALGAMAATIVPATLMQAILPVLLIAIALYFAFKPNMGDTDRNERMSPFLFMAMIVPAIGFYDGLFGPGTGSFYMLALVALAGYGVLKATAHTKFLNFATNIGAFAVFAIAGVIYWKIGLIMGIAQFLGARLGATLAMRIGSGLIKPLLVLVCMALAIKLLADPENPLRLVLDL